MGYEHRVDVPVLMMHHIGGHKMYSLENTNKFIYLSIVHHSISLMKLFSERLDVNVKVEMVIFHENILI